jgi:prenyltransferase beta subunit
MSWQLGAFAILFIVLAAGFGWYERSRPDARIVALVATLAAFAALGRIAFAALPNVKPTTDIVLISGYALGSAPGFVVGALAGLTSNFFFGQGPWTPWQMAAWGAAGLIGAGLGAATGRRLGRFALAAICALVGFAFTAVQDVGDWVTYSDHSLAQLGVYLGKGLGFDVLHAGGCLVFALAFGPMLVRSIGRFAAKSQVRWLAPGELTLPVAMVGLLLGGGLAARLPTGSGVARAAPVLGTPTNYLLAAQDADGGFGAAPGEASSQLFSGWAALGLAAAGEHPQGVRRRGHSLIAYLERGAGTLSDPGSLERAILAVAAAGVEPAGFGGHNLVAALEARIGGDGSIADQTNLTSFGVLALRAAHQAPSKRMWSWLVRQEDQDGGFNFGTAGAASDVDDTGAALEALAGAPGAAAARARVRAVAFIRRQQDSDGGFPAGPGAGSNAQSTAWAVQGLIAAGIDPATVRRAGAASPVQYLRSLIAPDGHVRYSRSSDQTPVWVTSEAIMALAGKPLPLAPAGSAQGPRPRPRPPRPRDRTVQTLARARPAIRSRARAVSPGRSAGSPGFVLQLASDAGVIDALALAPIGVG